MQINFVENPGKQCATRRLVVPRGCIAAGTCKGSSARTIIPALAASLVFHAALVGMCAGLRREASACPDVEVMVFQLGEQPVFEEQVAIALVPDEVPEPPDESEKLPEPLPVILETSRTEPATTTQIVPEPVVADIPPPPEATPMPSERTPAPAIELAAAPSVVSIVTPVTAALLPLGSGSPEASDVAVQAAPIVVSDATAGLGYWSGIRSSIKRHLKYPRVPAGMQSNTNILLRITIDDDGALVDAVSDDSQSSPFVLAAQRAVRRAAPFDPPGESVPRIVELPIRFERAN